MSLPCDAQATHYDAGGSSVAGPFDLDWDESRGLYTTGGGGGEQTIQWNGVAWIYTDAFGDEYVGGTDADDPSGDYVDTSSGSSSSALTITVTASGSSCSGDSDSGDSDSGDSGDSDSGSSSSGSAKSSSSVSESEAQP
jgi:hypothetical protein